MGIQLKMLDAIHAKLHWILFEGTKETLGIFEIGKLHNSHKKRRLARVEQTKLLGFWWKKLKGTVLTYPWQLIMGDPFCYTTRWDPNHL